MSQLKQLSILLLCFSVLLFPVPAFSADCCIKGFASEEALGFPVYKWGAEASKPRAIIVAIHGLLMHGMVYSSLAEQLNSENIMLVSLDLRGFGRWRFPDEGDSPTVENGKSCAGIDYRQSLTDIVTLLRAMHGQHPGVPVYLLGESLGADLSIRVAAEHQNLVDGLILSSPAIQFRKLVVTRTLLGFANPIRLVKLASIHHFSIDLSGFITGCYATEDSRVCKFIQEDRLVRHELTLLQLIKVWRIAGGTLHRVPHLALDLPVLVVQGREDRLLRSAGAGKLTRAIFSKNKAICWIDGLGHIIFETPYLKPQVTELVSYWVNTNVSKPIGQVKSSSI